MTQSSSNTKIIIVAMVCATLIFLALAAVDIFGPDQNVRRRLNRIEQELKINSENK